MQNRHTIDILAQNMILSAQNVLLLSPKTNISGKKVVLFAVEYFVSDPEIKVFGWKQFFIRAKPLFLDQKSMILAFEIKFFGGKVLLFSEKQGFIGLG